MVPIWNAICGHPASDSSSTLDLCCGHPAMDIRYCYFSDSVFSLLLDCVLFHVHVGTRLVDSVGFNSFFTTGGTTPFPQAVAYVLVFTDLLFHVVVSVLT